MVAIASESGGGDTNDSAGACQLIHEAGKLTHNTEPVEGRILNGSTRYWIYEAERWFLGSAHSKYKRVLENRQEERMHYRSRRATYILVRPAQAHANSYSKEVSDMTSILTLRVLKAFVFYSEGHQFLARHTPVAESSRSEHFITAHGGRPVCRR